MNTACVRLPLRIFPSFASWNDVLMKKSFRKLSLARGMRVAKKGQDRNGLMSCKEMKVERGRLSGSPT